MLADVFRRLGPFGPVSDYAYLGMGSLWFSDFLLFHRTLGIKDMVSIEASIDSKERFLANRPFNITLHFSKTTEAIPKIDWGRRQLVWLDYDGRIDKDVVADAKAVAGRALSGSVLAISVNCVAAGELDEKDTSADKIVEKFSAQFDPAVVPGNLSVGALRGWAFGKVSREILTSEIIRTLNARDPDPAKGYSFKPICEIEYNDNANMTTLVGLIHSAEDQQRADACAFEKLDFVDAKKSPVRITMPKLTTRELRVLEQQLPIYDKAKLVLGTIPESEAKSFVKIYRYFPNFSVLET
jgi:hypothetical protein